MNIGLVVPGFSADERDWCIPALLNLAARLALKSDVRVFALRYPHRSGRYDVFGARVTALGGDLTRGPGSVALWARTLSGLAAEHRHQPFDILHAFWAGETGMLAAIAGRILAVPTVVSLAGGELAGLKGISYGGQLARAERLKTALALRLADGVTAGSRHLQSLAARRMGTAKGRLRWAPLGVDTEVFQPPREMAGSSRARLVQAASLVPVKAQATLIEACAILRDMGLDFNLEIAGAGPLESTLREMIDGLALRNHVLLKGDITHDYLPSFYRGATAYVQSSLHEAQGMALLEAASCGVPAIGTRVGTLAELEPETAVGVPTGDAGQLVTAIATVLRNPARQATMATCARELVMEQYSLERCVERFRSVYTELC